MTLRRLLAKAWHLTLWRTSPARDLHGIRTGVLLAASPARCFDRIDEALDLLQRYDPASLTTLLRNFRGIIVFGTERFRTAYWLDEAGLCVLTARYLESPAVSPHDIALTLVHEGMHARLCAHGLPYHDGRRARIEIICAMAELALARRFPYATQLVLGVERRIDDWATSDETPWSDDTMHKAKLDYLRELGTPQWLITLLRKPSRRAA